MMLVSVVSLIISFLLQGLMSNYVGYIYSNFSIFSTVFLLINFVVLQPYFVSDKKFLIIIIIFGLLFDITYSNTFILCTCIFVLVFYVNKALLFFFPSNIFTINILSILSIIIYHCLLFLILRLLQFDSYSVIVLLKVILCNILVTIVYATILYYIINFLYEKMNLKIIRD